MPFFLDNVKIDQVSTFSNRLCLLSRRIEDLGESREAGDEGFKVPFNSREASACQLLLDHQQLKWKPPIHYRMFPRNLFTSSIGQSLRRAGASASPLSVAAVRSISSTCSIQAGSSRSNAKDDLSIASQTDASELHPLPKSVSQAGKPSKDPTPSQAAKSTRPAQPGPSAPTVDPSVAAPSHANRVSSANGNGNVNGQEDWATSFSGMSQTPFDKETAQVLGNPIDEDDIEVKPG